MWSATTSGASTTSPLSAPFVTGESAAVLTEGHYGEIVEVDVVDDVGAVGEVVVVVGGGGVTTWTLKPTVGSA